MGELLRSHVKVGRGLAPHWDDARARWISVWWLMLTLNWYWWRIGIGIRPRLVSLHIGPLGISFGPPLYRWRVNPTTTVSLAGDAYQDYNCTFTITTSSSSSNEGGE